VEKERIRSIIESLLFISGEPLSLERIVAVIEGVDKNELREAIDELAQEYLSQGRGIRIAEVAGGFQIETAKENAEYIARLIKTRPIRLTKPSLETIAIIAYRQPVTRQEIEHIRGVDSSGVIQTLLEYGFVQIMGRKDVPGRPLIYGTSKRFLEFFRLNSLADLPSLEEFFVQAEAAQAQGQNLFNGRYQEPVGAAENSAPAPESAQTSEPPASSSEPDQQDSEAPEPKTKSEKTP